METTQDTMTLGEARKQLSDAIQAVQEAAEGNGEAERNHDEGSWSRSQTYAVLLHRLQDYTSAQRTYDRVLAERVRRS